MKNKYAFWSVFALSLLGAMLSIRLLILDYQILFDSSYSPECNVSATWNCSAVATSADAYLAGIPVAALGLVGYLLVMAYMLRSRERKITLNLLLLYALFSVASLYFFSVSKLKLNVVCLYCLLTYLVNWGTTAVLGVLYWREREWGFAPKFRDSLEEAHLTPLNLGLYVLLTLLVVIPSALAFAPALENLEQLAAQNTTSSDTQKLELEGYPNGRYDAATQSARAGAEKGEIEMVIYSDYQCPFCAQFEAPLRQVLKEFGNVTLLRKEFPLDNSCNPIMGQRQLHAQACNAAYFALCAGQQGHFWEAAELLHRNHTLLSPQSIANLGQALELDAAELKACSNAESTRQAVLQDIQEGLKDGVKSTPTYIINGRVRSGVPSYAQLRQELLEAGAQASPEAQSRPE